MNLIFCLLTNVEGFFKLMLLFQVCVTRHVQIIKNNKFAISLQHVMREVSDAVNILHADKHESLQCLYNIPKKLEMKLSLVMQINIKLFQQLISTLWASKFSTT